MGAKKLTYNNKTNHYYPFGMFLPNSHEYTGEYRYEFNGMEKDDEIKGEGNSVNYKYRMHDPRIVRFFAVDPLAASYPHNSPYAFSENSLIAFVELEGLEKYSIHQRSFAPWPVFGHFNALPTGSMNPWFEGDDRGFSTSTSGNNTSRINSIFTVDISDGSLVNKSDWSNESVSYDDDGNVYSRKTGDPTFNIAGPKKGEKGRVRAKTYLSGNNPLVFASPPIQWDADISIYDHIEEGYIMVSSAVTGKGFPAYESFIEDEQGTKIFINAFSAPQKEDFFTRLAGPPNATGTPNITTKIATDTDGNFLGVYSTDANGYEIIMSPEAYNQGISSIPAAK